MDWVVAASIAQIATAFIAFAALLATPWSWKKASNAARVQAKEATVLTTNYEIYERILQNVNEILSKNSTFTNDLKQHTNIVADILNRWHGQGGYVVASNDERLKLLEEWKAPSEKIIENAYELQSKALELTRLLDMSGADFGDNSKVYNALWLIYHDLNSSISKMNDKWTKLDLNNTTVQQYQWLLEETYAVVDGANEFSNCVEDVLKQVYNKLVAIPMDKTPKKINKSEKRRMIMESGLRDNRVENAS